MMFNTPENRAKFVETFGPNQHPDGPWSVDDRTAKIILERFDTRYDEHRDPEWLWSVIMQNRATFMLGEYRIIEARKTRNIGDKRYAEIGRQITAGIYAFIDELKGE